MTRLVGDLEITTAAGTTRRHGSVWPARRGIWYRHRRSWPRQLAWSDLDAWSVGRDHTPDAPRHRHALVMRFTSGQLVLRVTGPAGVIALARFRDAVRPRLWRLAVAAPVPTDANEAQPDHRGATPSTLHED